MPIKLANAKKILYNRGMNIALFGGSFDPVHSEHIRLVEAAQAALSLDKAFVIPSYVAPHKAYGAVASGQERLQMCRLAFQGHPYVEASGCEIEAQGTSYTYLTCRNFRARFPEANIYFLVGADMLENFFSWRMPENILSNVTLVACGRDGQKTEPLRARFLERFGVGFLSLPFEGSAVSSSRIRVDLAFGRTNDALPPAVAAYIADRGLYAVEAIPAALSLEKEERREHSYRVARMAVSRSRSAGVPERKALLAAALHDCGKYVLPGSPRLEGFSLPEGVPEPVVHQYTGAYLAEHLFGVTDEEVLDAIRYHASGRENMTTLGKLIYLADLVEEGRDFSGVEALRALFWRDLDECLLAALEHQLAHLKATGAPVYPLTEQAYSWLKRHN